VQSTDTKVALLEGRVAETALQRTQLEELIQQLSRSRDENVLADIDAAIRVALQQVAITGSAEPMTSALRQSSAWPASTSPAWSACAGHWRVTSTASSRSPWLTSPR
jgi:hypothetical protein